MPAETHNSVHPVVAQSHNETLIFLLVLPVLAKKRGWSRGDYRGEKECAQYEM